MTPRNLGTLFGVLALITILSFVSPEPVARWLVIALPVGLVGAAVVGLAVWARVRSTR
jgi:hypothetical protein